MFDENFLSDVIYYSDKNFEEGRIKNCSIKNEFVFGRTNFYLCKKNLYYYVCVSKDGDMLSVWSHKIKNDDNTENTPSEIMSKFRNGFIKNNINKDMIDVFVTNPKKYKKQYLVKSKKA